ncbi:MAG: TldD/PmbA family protein [Thermotogaceae bacterium]|nr:TldD/PmbA family protein [Thermotogaceae bacterium]
MLDLGVAREILDLALEKGGDFSEIFIEETFGTTISYENGKVEVATFSKDAGFGIRVIDGELTYYASSSGLDVEKMKELAKGLADAVGGKKKAKVKELIREMPSNNAPFEIAFDEIPVDRKMEIVKRAAEIAKNYDERIVEVKVRYADRQRIVWIYNSEGKAVSDVRNYPVLYVRAVASDGKQIFSGVEGWGENKGFEFFTDEVIEKVARNAAETAIHQLEAEDAPAGEYTAVISSEAGGTMIHEACGHGLEADLVLKGGSIYAGKLGQKVAADGVTVIDDGTLKNFRGTLNVDDEGNPAKRNVLIENGVLKGYMHSRLTAKRMKVQPTGNGRRESYEHVPIPRMTNTFIAPGDKNPEEIIKSVDYGILVVKMGGGQVDIVSGDFTFGVPKAFLIENGKVTKKLRGVSLVGNGGEVLKNIEMVGNDIEYAVGTCGKDGQGAPVSDGLPTIKISKMVIGGKAK